MIHRHLEYPPDTPAHELPSPAIVDILDRGDMSDWQAVAVAISQDPHGPLAARVARLIDAYPMYGTSVLWRAWLERRRACQDARPGAAVPSLELAALRRRRGMTQVALAGRMGMSQSDLSKLERRRDTRLSTLRAYAHALGGRLRVLLVARDGDVEAEIVSPRPVS